MAPAHTLPSSLRLVAIFVGLSACTGHTAAKMTSPTSSVTAPAPAGAHGRAAATTTPIPVAAKGRH